MADYKSTHTGAEIDAGIDKATTAESNWSLLMANLGIGRWAGQYFHSHRGTTFTDAFGPYYTNIMRFAEGTRWINNEVTIPTTPTSNELDITLGFDINVANTKEINADWAFNGFHCKTLTLKNAYLLSGNFTFANMDHCTAIKIADGCKATVYTLHRWFIYDPELVEIGAFDLSDIPSWGFNFDLSGSPKVKSIHCTHWKYSFDISKSTAFEEADLVEIISNLDTVTTTQTLTMGATNLAKLTDDEKQVATDKGWVLA